MNTEPEVVKNRLSLQKQECSEKYLKNLFSYNLSRIFFPKFSAYFRIFLKIFGKVTKEFPKNNFTRILSKTLP